jgi:hypothetical protein
LSASGEFEKGAITAGRLRQRILQQDRVAVPGAVIVAVAVPIDIHDGECDVGIARSVDEIVPI